MKATQAIDPRYSLTDGDLFWTLHVLGRCGYVDGAPEGAVTPAALQALKVSITRMAARRSPARPTGSTSTASTTGAAASTCPARARSGAGTARSAS